MPFLDSLDRLATDGERYETLGELGRGGMGQILLVRDGKFGREVALKELPLLPPTASTSSRPAAGPTACPGPTWPDNVEGRLN